MLVPLADVAGPVERLPVETEAGQQTLRGRLDLVRVEPRVASSMRDGHDQPPLRRDQRPAGRDEPGLVLQRDVFEDVGADHDVEASVQRRERLQTARHRGHVLGRALQDHEPVIHASDLLGEVGIGVGRPHRPRSDVEEGLDGRSDQVADDGFSLRARIHAFVPSVTSVPRRPERGRRDRPSRAAGPAIEAATARRNTPVSRFCRVFASGSVPAWRGCPPPTCASGPRRTRRPGMGAA